MDQLEALRNQQEELRAKLKLLMAQLREVDEQLRERGELIFLEYTRYGSPVTEEFIELKHAMGTARALEDNADGSVVRIYGKGFSYENSEWHD